MESMQDQIAARQREKAAAGEWGDANEEAKGEEETAETEAKAEAETEGDPKAETAETKAEMKEEDVEEVDTDAPTTTALMTQEEVKTVWEKRLERFSDKVKSWKAYREVKKASRQLAQSDNPMIASAREKVKDAKDAMEDAKEMWETSQHPLIWKAREVSDTVFGETEQGFVKGEIKRIDPGFSEEDFAKEMKSFMIPIVVNAFMSGDLDFLRTLSRGEAEANFHRAITQRKTLGEVYDNKLLSITYFDVQNYAMEHGDPVITFMFVGAHQHCVRDPNGRLMQGNPSDLVNIQYYWKVQRTTTNTQFDWEITSFYMNFTTLIE